MFINANEVLVGEVLEWVWDNADLYTKFQLRAFANLEENLYSARRPGKVPEFIYAKALREIHSLDPGLVSYIVRNQ